MPISEIDRIISIDAECNGLGGQAFAVAMTLSDPTGELERVVYRCPIVEPVNDWVKANVLPALEDVEENCTTYAGMLYNLREDYFPWAEDGEAITIGHVVWPVEARLLLDMYPGEDIWHGPYPLIDVASVLLAKGHNPLSVDDYLREHGVPAPDGSPHHPLYDVRAAERCLRHLMSSATRPNYSETVHLTPAEGEGLTPCCGRPPFDLPNWERITVDPTLVTCHKHVWQAGRCVASGCPDVDSAPNPPAVDGD